MILRVLGGFSKRPLTERLLVLLGLALLPLGLIAIYQTVRVVSDANALAERNILSRTADAASLDLALIHRSWGAAAALGHAVAVIGPNTPDCVEILRNFVDTRPEYAFAGYITPDLMLRCSSTGAVQDVSDQPGAADFWSSPRRMVSVNSRGAISGLPVLLATVPIYDAQDEVVAAMTLSVPHEFARTLLQSGNEEAALAILNEDGVILSSSTREGDPDPIEDLQLIPKQMDVPPRGMTLTVTADDGARMLAAVVPVLSDRLFVAGRWASETQPYAVTLLGTATPAFPVVMWIASMFVAFFAIERLVLRHLRILRQSISHFSIDDRDNAHVKLTDAPAELSQIAASYNQMLDRITCDTQRLEASVSEKEALLKEIHHRVMNNLQLIASILNMQLRVSPSPDGRLVLRQLQRRVLSLAMIHKSVYDAGHLAAIRADGMLRELVDSIVGPTSGRRQKLIFDLDLAPVTLDTDRILPFMLIATEVLSNAVKHASSPDGPGRIDVSLREAGDGEVHLTIANTVADPSGEAGTQGTGAVGLRLIEAFTRQLHGHLDTQQDGAEHQVSLRFCKSETGTGNTMGDTPPARA